MKRFLAVLAITLVGLLAAAPAHAQNLEVDKYILQRGRDLDASSFEYCRTVGLNGVVSDRSIPLRVKLAATAASTTVTGTGAFTNVAVGDLLLINNAGSVLYRAVIARASADSITVDESLSAAALTNLTAQYRKLQCGTADTSGAFPVAGAQRFTVQLIMSQFVGTSVDYQLECRLAGSPAGWAIVSGPTNKVAVFNVFLDSEVPYDMCRVGSKINTDDVDDLTTNAERYTVLVTVRY
jgi:hypothetical protein